MTRKEAIQMARDDHKLWSWTKTSESDLVVLVNAHEAGASWAAQRKDWPTVAYHMESARLSREALGKEGTK